VCDKSRASAVDATTVDPMRWYRHYRGKLYPAPRTSAFFVSIRRTRLDHKMSKTSPVLCDAACILRRSLLSLDIYGDVACAHHRRCRRRRERTRLNSHLSGHQHSPHIGQGSLLCDVEQCGRCVVAVLAGVRHAGGDQSGDERGGERRAAPPREPGEHLLPLLTFRQLIVWGAPDMCRCPPGSVDQVGAGA
jgi:hypothetical protein